MVLEVKVYADADPYIFSYVYTGLFDLAYQGKISFIPYIRGLNLDKNQLIVMLLYG